MTAKKVDRYRLFCETENSYQYMWSDSVPVQCPNNNSHAIDDNTGSIVDTVNSAAVEVVQQTGTSGNYTCQSFCFDVPANSTVSKQYSWPYPVSISTMHFTSDATQVGGFFAGVIAPHTVLGLLTADLSSSGTILSVSSSVAKNAVVGSLATITDGTNTADLGNFYNIDVANNTVCVQNPPPVAFLTNSPTRVKMSFQNISLEIGQPELHSFGSQQLKGASTPPNTIMQISYTNSGPAPKRFRCWGELGY